MTKIGPSQLAACVLLISFADACTGADGGPADGALVEEAGGGVMSVGGQASGGNPGIGGRATVADETTNDSTGGTSASTAASVASGGIGDEAGATAQTTTGGSSRGRGSRANGGSSTIADASGIGGIGTERTSTGGFSKGGATTGGSSKGGATTGGSSKGGATTGGSSKGGATTGGAATGGATPTGGSTGACTPTFGEVPSNVSAWVDESWSSELGSNIKSREAWLLDSVVLGKGQINLCVRWGATTAPTAAVKTGMAAAVQKWFNDWFSQLKDYGCFPYPTITAKVTGWAVKSGNTGWVSDLGSDVKIYTETDAEGEPKCSDSCSFFTNWSHSFPKCSGGEAFHHDYWLWLDDSIGGGAAAVGGDWGLRMPVRNFINAMGRSDSVIEHEMGHGFGFQDYYTWKGEKPTGGSLMIVGSSNSQTPTTADSWLLRRAWKESKTLRGW